MSIAGLVPTIHWLEEAFERVGAARSYGGALAYNYYGPPRLTQDVDVLALAEGPGLGALLEALRGGGCLHGASAPEPLEPRAVLAELRAKPYFTELVRSGVRIELFVPWHAFHRRVLERSPRRDLAGRAIPIHAAEDLIVFKKVFDRPKDIQDIKAMLLSRKGLLDIARMLADARELLTTESLAELEGLVARYG